MKTKYGSAGSPLICSSQKEHKKAYYAPRALPFADVKIKKYFSNYNQSCCDLTPSIVNIDAIMVMFQFTSAKSEDVLLTISHHLVKSKMF